MYGKDFAYANTRIANTIVRIKKSNEPVVVQIVSDRGTCVVTPIEDMEVRAKDFKVHLDDLDISPVPLGYVNINGKAIYLQRAPIRRGPGNQGLTRANCISSGERLWGFPAKALRQCIMGSYPTFDKAIEESKTLSKRSNTTKLMAFHRHWAVSGESLFYKNELLVGSIVDGKPQLLSQYSYLKEALMELV